MQNPGGGYSDYELVRGPEWLELMNPAQVFGNIMIGYIYPECTTSSLLGLRKFQQHHPSYRSEEVELAVRRAVESIYQSQKEDGSWYGSWGICFTYAMFFALESLSTMGESYHTRSIALT
jgi:lanosterol synthase